MADNSFHTTVESLFKGMDSFITTKTVVGDAIHIGDTIILPLVDVSFGVAAGAFSQDKKNNGAGGMGGKIMPSAVLVIQNGTTKLVNIKKPAARHWQDKDSGYGAGFCEQIYLQESGHIRYSVRCRRG